VKDDLWWVIPGQLAGMPRPFLDPNRRSTGGVAINAFGDDLRPLHDAGIRAVVSLLNIPGDARIYAEADFAYFPLSIPDGSAPTAAEADAANRFIDAQLARGNPVAIHCAAGLGRTGTMLAAYLIHRGARASEAIARIRAVEPAAIETDGQVRFLREFEVHVRDHPR
jgi:atypical dual specificity phosphatase